MSRHSRRPVLAFFMFCVVCTASTLQLLSQQQNNYAALVAQAKADLNAGNSAKALDEAEQAERLDAKPWEAFVVAGAAQQLQKAYGAAIQSFTQALSNAPEDKKAAINGLLQKCIQLTQQAASPPTNTSANSSDHGPSLANTMQFIQDKLNALGPIKYIVYFHDKDAQDYPHLYVAEFSKFTADPQTCQIHYHYNFAIDAQVFQDFDSWFSLKTTKNAQIMTKNEAVKLWSAENGVFWSGTG